MKARSITTRLMAWSLFLLIGTLNWMHAGVPQSHLIMRIRFDDSVMVEPEGIPVGLQGIPYIRFSEDAKDGMAIDFSAGVDQPEVMNAEDDHYVAVLRPPSIEKLFTLSIWFKSTEGENLATDRGLLSWGSETGFGMESHGITLTKEREIALTINTQTTSELRKTASLEAVRLADWNHLVYTFDDQANAAIVYLNGLEIIKEYYDQEIIHRGLPIYIGANPTGRMKIFHGLMDDFRLYDRALNLEEVSNLMNEYLPRGDSTGDQSLALRMRFDGDPSVDGADLLSLIHQPQGVSYVDQAISEKGLDLSAGTGGYVTVMTPPALEERFTLCMWIRLPAQASPKRYGLFSWGPDLPDGVESHGLFIEEGNNLLSIQNFKGTISSGLKVSLGNIDLSQWTHIAYVYDLPGKRHTLYANGRRLGSNRYIHPIEVKGQNLIIGANPIDTLETFPGWIDEFRLYDGLMEEAQIRELIAEHTPSLRIQRIEQGNLLSITNPRPGIAEVWGSWDLKAWQPVYVSPEGAAESFFFDNEQFENISRFYRLNFSIP